MTEALTKKKRTRAGHKASATRTVRQMEEVVAEEELDKARLALLRLTLKEKLETIKNLDAEIVDLIEDEAALIEEIEQADDYKETIFSALIKAEKLLKDSPATSPISLLATPPVPAAAPSAKSHAVRLPKLHLRHFNGDMTKWTSFWQAFEAAVDNNPDLSNVEKFNYLSSLLEGAAREAIAGLALTEANYAEAVSTLKRRFGGTQQIIGKHMEALLQVEAVSNPQNVKALRRLFDNISTHMRSLASLDVRDETYGNLLCPVLINKIPSEMQLIVSRKVPEADWDLKSLMSAIEEEIVARERLGPPTSRRRHEGKTPPTATTLVTKESPVVTQDCCYCNLQHRPSDCTVVTQVEARKQLLRKVGRCYSCLRRGHLSRNCRMMSRCQVCRGKHHTSICDASANPKKSTSEAAAMRLETVEPNTSNLDPGAPEFSPGQPNLHTSTLHVSTSRPVLLQTASAVVFNPQDSSLSSKLRIVMDSGSQRSYLTQRARNTLRLHATNRQRLAIAAFGAKQADPQLYEVVHVSVRTRVGIDKNVDLVVVPHICEPLTMQPITKCLELHPHLLELDLADDSLQEMHEIDMLIGSDFYWEFATGEVRHGEGGPTAVSTTLGWVLSGPTGLVGYPEPSVNLVTTYALRVDDGVTNKMLDATLRSFWELESLGVQAESVEDSVSDQFASSVKLKGGRYEVSLPWRQGHDPLPTNYDLSRRRLAGLLRRLKQTPEILKEYDSIIQTQLQQGVAEVVKEDDTAPEMVHYLPHHAVVRRDKDTTKVRVVYDASAKSSGPSLNDCLHVGPKFNQRINELLFRFRSYPVALVADIEKAFLMVSVNPTDRDVLRFLWVENPFGDEVKPVTLRFTRVVFGISSSPFLLNATLRCHLEQHRFSFPDLVESLNRSMYVDDLVAGADSEDDAFRLYIDSKEILSRGSFNLRKFVSNSPQVQNRIDEQEATLTTVNPAKIHPPLIEPSEESFSEVTLPAGPNCLPGEHKVLGVHWDLQSDQLVFDLRSLAEKAKTLQPTKRNVVSLIGQIYDPLGYLSPVTVAFKILMQEVCKMRVAWDQPLAGETFSRWEVLIEALAGSRPLRLPRYYFHSPPPDLSDKFQLFGFCDASKAAYAAVVYIMGNSDRHSTPSFVVSKTRVSPLKVQTTPRLELLSALLLARLLTNVIESLTPRYELLPPMCFTDSQVALFWIKGTDKDWKPFVQNRVEEIRQLMPCRLWSHCPGKENPADIPSRGLSPIELLHSKTWRNGPEWLKTRSKCCPLEPDNDMPEQCMVEMKTSNRSDVPHSLLTHQVPEMGSVIHVERFSTTHKLYRVTAYVLKFVQLLMKRVASPKLTQRDLTLAEELWIQSSQAAILKDRRFPAWRTQFGLFQDERGLWRCGGRLQNADLPYSAKHPILLNRNHCLTTLVVRGAHRRVHHSGVRETLTEVRSKFWIVGGRSLVRSILHHCVVCRRFEGRPICTPPQPPLPEFRVRESPPFSFTAVDFAGPLYLRGKEASDGTKTWICLFTCCATRAIHLELVLDMTAATFVRCVKRFAARRGLPRKFISDNAKTFRAAAKTLKAICEHPDVKEHLSLSGIDWSFNLEKAPWWGGLFERMVQSTKRCLRKVLGRARLSYDEMHTAVVEVEAIVNSRPLSYLHPDDMEQPLTPSHLLVGRRLFSLPDHLTYLELEHDEDFELNAESLQRRAKHLNGVLNHFWRRWSREYLLELRDRHRQGNSEKPCKSLEAGDLVLVHDQDRPRGLWKIARVQGLITGRDGVVRGAVLKVASQSGPPTTLQRPLQLLYPLEISGGSLANQVIDARGGSTDKQRSPSQAPVHEVEHPASPRPQREAAVRARKLVRQRCSEDLIDHS